MSASRDQILPLLPALTPLLPGGGLQRGAVVTVGAETETLERPRDKDIDVQQLVDLRRMLTNAGYASGLEHADSSGRED